MQHKKVEKSIEDKEVVCRKCNTVYAFLGIIFFFVLLVMFICVYAIDFWTLWNSSVLQFFFLVEVIIAIAIFEQYMDIMIVWKDWVKFESWILVKNKKEIPYDKINSVNIYSAFWLWNLEILTWNDVMTVYKFLDNYDEVGKIIKERVGNNKK